MTNNTIDANCVREAAESRKSGRRVLYALLGFFVLFAAVDLFFVYKAVSTHSGVVVENAYEYGLNYNDIIQQAKDQKAASHDTKHSADTAAGH